MEIKTKLSVNQNCWFIADRHLGNSPINKIVINVEETTIIKYCFFYKNIWYEIHEQYAFPTRQELIDSL